MMDPNACFKAVLEAMLTGNMVEACDLFQDLEEWMEKGGYEPNWKLIVRETLDDPSWYS